MTHAGRAPPRRIVVVEGVFDGEFLRRLTRRLHAAHPEHVPDLAASAERGELLFVPAGGGDREHLIRSLAEFGLPLSVLLDREALPVTQLRQQRLVQLQADFPCISANLTPGRSLENLFDPTTLAEAGLPGLTFGPDDHVPTLVAQRRPCGDPRPWSSRSRRSRLRAVHHAKRWLNTVAVNHLTLATLRRQDPRDEFLNWCRGLVR